LEELKPFLDRENVAKLEKPSDIRDWIKITSVALVVLALSVVLFFNLRSTSQEIGASEPHNYYKGGADWLRTHVPPGAIVFNTDWDDFPRLFYYDSSHYYISGLDPTYLFDKNPDLSNLYERITLGKEEDPGPLIRDRFGARYVFSDNNHHEFFSNARSSGWFDIVYEDTDCTVMHIRDEKSGSVEGTIEPDIEPSP
jgi:hypothetical protein